MAKQTGSPVWIGNILKEIGDAAEKNLKVNDGEVEISLEYTGDYYLDKDTDIGSQLDVDASLPTALPPGSVTGKGGLDATLSKETEKGMDGRLKVRYAAKLRKGNAQ
jgi:hypothetical protein